MDSPRTSASTSPAKGWPAFNEIGADMVGELIDGRYRIIRRLARGGMADVFLSKDPTRRCYVAIKLLRTRNTEALRRFAIEAEVLSNIQHPNIVRAIAFGETPDSQPYMALEYLEGEPLSQRLLRGPLPWREVVELGLQIAGAAHALHVTGVIHRDIKPDNIVITTTTDRSVAKLIDLGLASVGAPFHEAQSARFSPVPAIRHKTQLGHPIGTPDYLPPEAGQCEADPRLDVFSLGATLYELCTRQFARVTGGRPIQEVCPSSDAPDDLSRLLRAALAPDPGERLPSADHLRRGLEAILAAHPRTTSPGHLFGGSYDRLEVLGVGASAVVFRASDRWLSREVAVKVLRDAEPSDDDVLRFRRAAKILSALRHPNVPRILHFGVAEGQLFAVTELCTGAPATDFVRPDKHLRPDEVIALGIQLAEMLAAVHAIGVVYRDLHPGNVLIARGDTLRAWLFDFDHAQVSPGFYARLTERWATPPEERVEPVREKPLQNMDYAAPEVRAGAAFTAASDVFALGLLLYRLLTGQRPFPPAGGEPTPPRKVSPACPHGLAQVLLRMLGAKPDERPSLQSVRTILADEQAELEAETEDDEIPARSAAAAPVQTPVTSVAAPAAAPELAASVAPAGVTTEKTAAVSAEAATNATTQDGTGTTASVALVEADIAAPSSVTTSSAHTEPSPEGRHRRFLGLLALVSVAAISLAIGRATAPHVPSAAVEEHAAIRPGTPSSVSIPEDESPGHAEDAPVTAPRINTVGDGASAPRPAAGPKNATTAPANPRPTRRSAVTAAEATAAAQRVVSALRDCTGAPSILTVDLDVAGGRGAVTALNLHALAPEDPRYRWHACVQRHLERVRFPVSETPGHTRIRLTLP